MTNQTTQKEKRNLFLPFQKIQTIQWQRYLSVSISILTIITIFLLLLPQYSDWISNLPHFILTPQNIFFFTSTILYWGFRSFYKVPLYISKIFWCIFYVISSIAIHKFIIFLMFQGKNERADKFTILYTTTFLLLLCFGEGLSKIIESFIFFINAARGKNSSNSFSFQERNYSTLKFWNNFVNFLCSMTNIKTLLLFTGIHFFIYSIFSPIAIHFNSEKLVYVLLILSFFLCTLFFIFRGIKKNTVAKISNLLKVRFIGLDCLDFFDSLLINSFDGKKIQEKNRVFQVDLSAFIPNNAENIEIQTPNFHGIHAHRRGNKYLYFSVSTNSKKTIPLTMKVFYSLEGKTIQILLKSFIRFTYIGNEFLAVKTTLVDFKENKRKTNTLKQLFTKENKGSNLMTLLPLYCFYKEKPQKISFDRILSDSRKFLFHHGKFGTGKTAYDCFAISESGKRPIHISFSNDNYEKNLLYMIFKKIRLEVMPVTFRLTMDTLIPRLAIALLFLAGARGFLGIYDKFYQITDFLTYIKSPEFFTAFSEFQNIWLFMTSKFGFLILSFLIGLLAGEFFVPDFLIYKKNPSQSYEDFLLSGIAKMVKTKNLVLVLEDIDRCPNVEVESFFRLLSSLNHAFRNIDRVVGIVSFDKENLKQKKDVPINDNTTFSDFKEKVIIGEILNHENTGKESMQMYARKILLYYSKCLEIDTSENLSRKESSSTIEKFIESQKKIDFLIQKNNVSYRKLHELIFTLSILIEDEKNRENDGFLCAEIDRLFNKSDEETNS